jgi:hypothetical protein
MESNNTDVNDLSDLLGSTLQIKDDKPLTLDELKTKENQEINNDESILKIQNWFRNICNKINIKISIKCKLIIELLNKNPDIMRKYFNEINIILKKFPPAKNENKFIYGKLCEKSLSNAFIEIGFKCEDLDQTHTSGSEYKNDIKMLKLKYSIKACKNKSTDVRLINTLSTTKHNINMTLILISIDEKKLYFIPSHIVNQEVYLKQDSGSISYKSKLFKWIRDSQPEYIYNFPTFTPEQETNINKIQEVMIYEYLYDTFIKST